VCARASRAIGAKLTREVNHALSIWVNFFDNGINLSLCVRAKAGAGKLQAGRDSSVGHANFCTKRTSWGLAQGTHDGAELLGGDPAIAILLGEGRKGGNP
jgi:hypothetical protein